MIRSKIQKGLQRKGNTKTDSTILIEETGAMQITVRAGRFTDTLGESFDLLTDRTVDLTAGTNNFLALVYNPSTKVTDVWHATDPEAQPPIGFKELQMLIGWGWFIIPLGTTDIANIPLYCFTWIDNDVQARYKKEINPKTFRVVDRIKFYGRGEETGEEYEIDEMVHFIAGQPGVYFMCPVEGAVTRGRPCKVCGNMNTVKIKESK